jgi:hypothetical protein
MRNCSAGKVPQSFLRNPRADYFLHYYRATILPSFGISDSVVTQSPSWLFIPVAVVAVLNPPEDKLNRTGKHDSRSDISV